MKRQQIASDVLSADHDRFDDHAGIQQAIMLGIREKVSMPMRESFSRYWLYACICDLRAPCGVL